MAQTEVSYTGDGTTVLFSFAFPFLDESHVKVSLNGTATTGFTLANATTVQMNTAPGPGVIVRIFRKTGLDSLDSQFFPGSAIRAQDLNQNFTQNLYSTQESNRDVTDALATADGAVTTANAATSTATTALGTANTASSDASAAVATANTASSNASAAVATANTASSDATNAVNTANSAVSTANSASSTATTALSTANTASSTATSAANDATSAVVTSDSALSAANSAVSTANTASSVASTALSTANTAASNASTAISTANSAEATANSAAAAVAAAVAYQPVVNLAALALLTPADGEFFELQDSSGADTDPSITGVPVGLVGAPGLTFRLKYEDPPGDYVFLGYFANDSENQYLKTGTGTVTSTNILDGTIVNADINASAAIGLSKLATGALPTAITVASANIVDGTIVDADVNASAAIAGTKISPNFGTQNVVTTGTSTAASLIPTGSSVPTNGVYLPAANSVAISSNSVQRVFVDGNATVFRHSQSELGVGTGRPFVQLHGNLASSQFASYAAYNWVNGAQDAGFNLYKSRSGTIGTNALVSNGDNLGRIGFHGDTGAEFVSGGDIISQVDGVPSGTSMPGRLLLRTTPSSSTVPTERMRLDSSGRLGLGTSSPGTLLDVVNGVGRIRTGVKAGSNAYLKLESTDASNSMELQFSNSTNANWQIQSIENGVGFRPLILNPSAGNVGIGTTSPARILDVSSVQQIVGHFKSSSTIAGRIGISDANTTSDVHVGIGAVGDNLLLFANSGERARIDTSGRFLVGTSTNLGTLTRAQVRFVGASAEFGLGLDADSILAGTQWIEFTSGGGTARGSIDWSGSAVRYNTSSDYRLKENILPIANAVTRLSHLKPCRFNFVEHPEQTIDGFIAHEAQEIVPECVTGTKDEVDEDGNPVYQGIDQSKLVPLLTAALQEAIGRIETLEAEVADLKAQ
jgi:hypothetical protein